jgi:hypothetical protein
VGSDNTEIFLAGGEQAVARLKLHVECRVASACHTAVILHITEIVQSLHGKIFLQEKVINKVKLQSQVFPSFTM